MSIYQSLTRLLRPHRSYPYLIGTVALGMTLWVSSLTATGQNSSSPKIMATFLPMYLFTKGVTGSEGQVDLLVPPNLTVHNYQASPNNVRSLAEANVLVKNGLGMEEFLDQLITNAGNTQLKQINASQGIEALKEEEHHDENHNHSHEEGNPHVWLDPVLAQQQVINIRDGLIAADPNNRQTYQANAAVYLDKLKQLDQQFKTRLSSAQGCRFIAFHDAYPYLAKRYGLQQMAVVELPEDSLSPRDIQRVINATKEYNVKALLSETGVSDSRLQQIANDTGLPVKALDPIETGSLDPQYYFTAMQKNLETLAEVCQ
jgi:zinc/manganese transport system substrate-binding protein